MRRRGYCYKGCFKFLAYEEGIPSLSGCVSSPRAWRASFACRTAIRSHVYHMFVLMWITGAGTKTAAVAVGAHTHPESRIEPHEGQPDSRTSAKSKVVSSYWKLQSPQ